MRTCDLALVKIGQDESDIYCLKTHALEGAVCNSLSGTVGRETLKACSRAEVKIKDTGLCVPVWMASEVE